MPKFFSVRKAGERIGDGMYIGKAGLFQFRGYGIELSHPPPWDDTDLRWGETEVTVGVPAERCRFGFGSLEQLKSWLYNHEWREYLHEHGYVVKVWEVPAGMMHVGSAQAIAVDTWLADNACEYLSLLDLASIDLPF